MRLRRRLALLLALTAGALDAADLNVYAAASLADALGEIAKAYESLSGDTIRLNLGASSVLALQIKQGAPADVFFSADEAKLDALAQSDLLAPGTRRSLLSNTLVLVVRADSGDAIATPADLTKPTVRHLAVAEPQTVPAGIYAKAWLETIGLWKKVSDRIVPTENVRACLAAVEAGNADAGIVYRTDALISKKIRIAFEVPAAAGPAISYGVAVLQDSRRPDAARRFATHLASPEARAVFLKYGFLPAR